MNVAVLYIYIYTCVCVNLYIKISLPLSEIQICFELTETKRKTGFLRKLHYSFAAERQFGSTSQGPDSNSKCWENPWLTDFLHVQWKWWYFPHILLVIPIMHHFQKGTFLVYTVFPKTLFWAWFGSATAILQINLLPVKIARIKQFFLPISSSKYFITWPEN